MSICHGHTIVHRDLKPDNISWDKKKTVTIMFFVPSTQPGQMLNQQCGAYHFGAPELFLAKFYDSLKNDILTLWLNIYFMIVGKVTFDSVIIQKLRRQVVPGVYPAQDGGVRKGGGPA